MVSKKQSLRGQRKLEHIQRSLALKDGPIPSGLGDVHLIHQAAPELALEEIDLSVAFMGKKLQTPLIINAMTGGNPEVLTINRALARIARTQGMAMAVGSQMAALEDPTVVNTYQVVREENPNGVILANIGALTAPELAVQAVEMIYADGLQVHLNVPQELAMVEGDRNFRGLLANLQQIVESVSVPVIVKEVGFGLSTETIVRLYETGVRWVDLGGQGGTNFIAIESQRGRNLFSPSLEGWGIPTAISLLETLGTGLPLQIIATGGIRSALDIARVLALGAGLAGMAGPILRMLLQESPEATQQALEQIKCELRCIFLMCGARNVKELQQKPVVVLGRTREWLEQRGIDTSSYARRVNR